MNIIEVVQGTPAWLDLRRSHDTASEAPAALGKSKYMSRAELLKQKATGIAEEVGQAKQALFNRGHAAEVGGRKLAEVIIGTDLYPITATREAHGLSLLASLDGATMDESVIFEHKLWSESLAAQVKTGELDPHYTIQMDQQLLVVGAEKCLFMVSDGTPEKMAWIWYFANESKFAELIAGWKQFHADLAAYVPAEAPAPAVATPTLGLPAVSIRVDGSIALIDNLDVFGEALKAYIAGLVQKPETDQHFADLDSAVKTLKKAEEALDAAENGALAQTSSIDAMRKTVALYRDLARTNRLMAEKLVKTEKDNRKIAIITAGRTALGRHESGLQERTQHHLPPTQHNFEGVCKGLKTIASIQNAVDTELARCKIEANATADRIEANLKAIAEARHDYLFADVGMLALKDPEYVAMAVKNRIADHQAKEAEKEEATRQRIRQEEIQRADREAMDKLQATYAAAKPSEPLPVAKLTQTILRQPPLIESAPTLKLGTIAERLGFNLTAAFISSLGFEPAAKMNNTTLYHEDDFSRICIALIQHIESVCEVA